MISVASAAAISLFANAAGASTACEPDAYADAYTPDVCADWIEAPAYSATMFASLNPQPAAQSVMITRVDGEWVMFIAGYSWEPGTPIVATRRNEVRISDEEADAIASMMEAATLERLAAQPYYGSDDVICTDGASYQLAMADEGQRHMAASHSCAGKGEINDISNAFRELALKYDPEFEGMLTGLSGPANGG